MRAALPVSALLFCAAKHSHVISPRYNPPVTHSKSVAGIGILNEAVNNRSTCKGERGFFTSGVPKLRRAGWMEPQRLAGASSVCQLPFGLSPQLALGWRFLAKP